MWVRVKCLSQCCMLEVFCDSSVTLLTCNNLPCKNVQSFENHWADAFFCRPLFGLLFGRLLTVYTTLLPPIVCLTIMVNACVICRGIWFHKLLILLYPLTKLQKNTENVLKKLSFSPKLGIFFLKWAIFYQIGSNNLLIWEKRDNFQEKSS